MVVVQRIDIMITCGLLILVYAVIAKERSLFYFEEESKKNLINKQFWQALKRCIVHNKVALILLPLGGTILFESFGLINTSKFIQDIMGDESVLLFKSGIEFEYISSFIEFVYFHLSVFIGNSGYINYYNYILVSGGIILFIYIIKKNKMFSKIKKIEVSVLVLIQIILLICSMIIKWNNTINNFVIVLFPMLEVICYSYILSILLNMLIIILIKNISAEEYNLKDIIDLSIKKNTKLFIVLVVYNLIEFQSSILFNIYIDSIFQGYYNLFNLNSANLIKILLSFFVPILVVRMSIYKNTFREDIKLTIIFIRKNLKKLLVYMVIFTIINMLMYFCDNVLIVTRIPILFFLISILRLVLVFPVRLVIFVCFIFIIYRICEKDNDCQLEHSGLDKDIKR